MARRSHVWPPPSYIMLPPFREMNTHQRLEQPPMRRHAQVQELVHDDEVLESLSLFGEIVGQRDRPTG